MIMTFDIGNTNIALGVFQAKKLLASWKVKSDREKTADEYGLILCNLLGYEKLSCQKIKGAIISSVVPPITPVIEQALERFFSVKPLVVGSGLKTGMPILYENPAEVGSDRIVAACAAYKKYGGPCLVVDFGTATTFDAISPAGEYLGGSIAPGIQISAEALYLRTARLPRIEIKKPRTAIGRNTVSSMQSGLYFGYIGLVSQIIVAMSAELQSKPVVIATGGQADLIAPDIKAIDYFEPSLVLEGLRLLYEKNRPREKK
ncbi:MAG TPA: type III pantothenate kinase [Candidatus Saccharicenans sp.]|jgi:type III pantothenate kinase|nr:type III pantothenate kinase [Candidatus Saccharicenans sp.]HRD02886.1 type III pantothenate kinase [Candidatus Saccharicenans sp.]